VSRRDFATRDQEVGKHSAEVTPRCGHSLQRILVPDDSQVSDLFTGQQVEISITV
jgi:hypothetical protein